MFLKGVKIQVSQEAGQVVWYTHLFQNFPQFVVIHTVKGFGVVDKAGVDVFLELSCFYDDPNFPCIGSITTPRSTSTEQVACLPLGTSTDSLRQSSQV